jgi:hypothetical protein
MSHLIGASILLNRGYAVNAVALALRFASLASLLSVGSVANIQSTHIHVHMCKHSSSCMPCAV